MKTLFRVCVYYCVAMIVFTLALNLVNATGAFESITIGGGSQITDTDDALKYASPLETQNMNYIWGLLISATILGGAASILTRSIVPLGIGIFGGVFWSSYVSAWSSINVGGYLPSEFIVIFTVASVFCFVGAIIGMITGSG